MALTPDGNTLLMGNDSHSVVLWDLVQNASAAN
jgi:hypothetical protein